LLFKESGKNKEPKANGEKKANGRDGLLKEEKEGLKKGSI
jgi:hypothetical protein